MTDHPKISRTLEGRVAIVTGAAAGLGRAEALALAERGAHIVLTDIGDMSATEAAVQAHGVRAVCVPGNISDWDLADRLVDAAVTHFSRLDIVVNNAGITRDGMLFSMSQQQWDAVVEVHLRGHAALGRAAGAYWRNLSKTEGRATFGRIINTASEAALTGSASQPNYAAAKAGIVSLTIAEARSLAKYGVTANAICPRARTAMTAGVFEAPSDTEGVDPLAPEHVANFVAYLASEHAADITGRSFVVYGSMVALVARPAIEAVFTAEGDGFTDAEVGDAITAHLALHRDNPTLAHELKQLEVAAGLS